MSARHEVIQQWIHIVRPEEPVQQEGSLWNREDRQKTVELLETGRVVAVFNESVGALLVDAHQSTRVDLLGRVHDKINEVKGGGREGSPLSAMLPAHRLVELIDDTQIHPNLLPIINNPHDLDAAFGHMGFLRIPLKKRGIYGKWIPQSMKSTDKDGQEWFQSYSASGHPGLNQLVAELDRKQILTGISSLNNHGQPEIVDQEEARSWAHQRKLFFLEDDRLLNSSRRIGSYPVLVLDKNGITVWRQGNLPYSIYNWAYELEIPLRIQPQKKQNHPIRDCLSERLRDSLTTNPLTPQTARITTLMATRTLMTPEEIKNRAERIGRSAQTQVLAS